MYNKQLRLKKGKYSIHYGYLWSMLVAVVLSFVLYVVIFGIGTMADALRGVEIMQQFNKGGDWNTVSYPNVSGPYSFFVAWWAPAQWMVPYFLSKLIGQHLQFIQIFLVVICTFIGLFGYLKLFKNLGFSSKLSYLSLLVISTNPLFYWHYFLYYGGDLFLFAFFPFYILCLLWVRHNFNIKNWLIFLIITFLGLSLKNTTLVFFCGGLSMLCFSSKFYLKENWKKHLFLGLGFVLILSVFYFTFLQFGSTPSTAIDYGMYRGVPNNFLSDVLYPLGAPVGALSGITAILQKMAPFMQNYNFVLLIAQFIVVLVTLFLFRFIRIIYRDKQRDVKDLCLFFILPILFVFVYFYISDKAISYNMRHFAPLAYLFIPPFLEWIFTFKRGKNIILTGFFILLLFNLSGFYVNAYQLAHQRTQFDQLLLRKEQVQILKTVAKWDATHQNSIMISIDDWIPIIAVKNNDKLAIYKENKQWQVQSGMELDHPPLIDFQQLKQKQYAAILLIIPHNKQSVLKEIAKRLASTFRSIKTTEKYTIYSNQ